LHLPLNQTEKMQIILFSSVACFLIFIWVQRAKDQIKIHADIPTFKNFIQEECEKVLVCYHTKTFNITFNIISFLCIYLPSNPFQPSTTTPLHSGSCCVHEQVEKFYLQTLEKVVVPQSQSKNCAPCSAISVLALGCFHGYPLVF
jgi:hypothetical protein